jgi:hypothetical protein
LLFVARKGDGECKVSKPRHQGEGRMPFSYVIVASEISRFDKKLLVLSTKVGIPIATINVFPGSSVETN